MNNVGGIVLERKFRSIVSVIKKEASHKLSQDETDI